MQKILKALLISLTALIIFSGCQSKIVLHPVSEKDIRMDGTWVCMTPEYIQSVMKVRLEK